MTQPPRHRRDQHQHTVRLGGIEPPTPASGVRSGGGCRAL